MKRGRGAIRGREGRKDEGRRGKKISLKEHKPLNVLHTAMFVTVLQTTHLFFQGPSITVVLQR